MSELFADRNEQSSVYDCIVVGGGVIGSGAALQLVKEGYKTLQLEQFTLPHSRGSSAGPSRMYRNVYSQEHHAAMARKVIEMWEELEQETNTKLHWQTGLLVLDRCKTQEFRRMKENLTKYNLPFEELTTKQLVNRYPLMSYKGPYHILLDHEAGVLLANKCLKIMQDLFVKKGGVLRDGEKVVRIIPGRIVTVCTSSGREYKAGSLVLTPGPWASKMLKPLGLDLPLKAWRVSICYFKEKQPGAYWNYPPMFDRVGNGFIYCFPSQDYPGYMKFGYHLRWNEVDPDSRDIQEGQPKLDKPIVDIEAVKNYVKEHFPGLEPEPSIIENCMYTCTPEEEIIVDSHPTYPNIAIGCGFSGKGFKMAPLTGKILADLAMGKPPTYDLSPIGIKRFLHQKAKL
ncbi:peroxisomal sarcosine oxidase-like [Patiria miniata]|uniref:FAD dependent oxidoreductase domain-containing protein n=1 Tax=Patiria miniata TaxID=46514 RepID=A0A913ZPT3_PATMI|nr:peroxisomal sarcosine oxidase-like [Patiria miniata]XP_038053788.1 peroxisomal sarcosine oxidase-like [Patiria miniata]